MKYQDRTLAIIAGAHSSDIEKYQGINRKKKQIIPAISLFAFSAPSNTGKVFMPARRSPSSSLMSLIFATAVKKMMIAKTKIGGKTMIFLLGLTRKNPPIMTERQARLTKKEFTTTNFFKRRGGFEYTK